MNIDTPTLLLMYVLIVTVSTITVVLNTVLRRNDAVGRIWSTSFVVGILTALAYTAYVASPGAWWLVPVGNAAHMLSLTLLWSGCRAYNARPPWLPVAFAGTLVVVAALLLRGPSGGEWSDSGLMLFALAVPVALAAGETLRGRLRHSPTGRLLTTAFIFDAAYYLLRTAVFVIDGPDGQVFRTAFSSTVTAVLTCALVIVAANCVSVLQAVREEPEGETSSRSRIPGVLARTLFDEVAADWMDRARRERGELVLIVFEIDDLAHINSAFGRATGDRVVDHAARVVARQAPVHSVLGRLGHHRLAVLSGSFGAGEPAEAAERLASALVEAPVPDTEELRASTTWGVATTELTGTDYRALFDGAEAALTEARTRGAGSVMVARPLPS